MRLLDHPTPIGAARPDAADASLREIDGRTVAWFRVDGRRADSSGAAEAQVVARALTLAGELGCPVVGLVRSVAADVGPDGLDALAAWGSVAAAATRLSGVVPLLVALDGPVHGSLAMVVGLADHVVVTPRTTAYVNGPSAVQAVTGTTVTAEHLGGGAIHASRSGVASLVASDSDDAVDALSMLLGFLPDNYLADLPCSWNGDPVDRPSAVAAGVVPADPARAYDVRTVVTDVVDRDTFEEVHAAHAPNVVTGYGRVGGRPVAVVANQPGHRAGTLDIDGSVKAARHVRGADAFGLSILTFIDTPGYEPGRDLERRGMIRHGAKLVHAYAAATVPRIGIVLRKAYGGAYIAMDSRTMGNDLTLAWPNAEIAVMGAPGAVAILHRQAVADAEDPDAHRLELEGAYRRDHCTPRRAAERGLVDQVIDPADTRPMVAAALRRLATKRPTLPARKHPNEPL